MNKLKSILLRWLLSNYTTFKTFTFWKLSLKRTTLGFLFIRGLPFHEWNEIHPSTMTTVEVYCCKNFHYLKSDFGKHTTFGSCLAIVESFAQCQLHLHIKIGLRISIRANSVPIEETYSMVVKWSPPI